jgi:murein DD-endopeptidase MepM/ murein hydrolase activator NlpD
LPGVYSIYFHLDRIQVEAGEMVEQAQVIGTVGMSGLATGPHLHWEVRVNGVAVDPRPLTQVLIPDTIHATGIGE